MQETLDEIVAERERQDVKWGGPEHDDGHRLSEWNAIIDSYNRDGENALDEADPMAWRCRMLQVAALAVAALESFDRKADASADFVEAHPNVLVDLVNTGRLGEYW